MVDIRCLLVITALLLTLGCAGPTPQPIEILGSCGWCWPHKHKKKEQVVLRNKEDLLRAWRADGGDREKMPKWAEGKWPYPLTGEPKDIDFSQHTVIAVFLGEATDHDDIRVESVAKEGKRVIVEYREIPVARGIAPQPACPLDIVVVPWFVEEVKFRALPRPPRGEPVP